MFNKILSLILMIVILFSTSPSEAAPNCNEMTQQEQLEFIMTLPDDPNAIPTPEQEAFMMCLMSGTTKSNQALDQGRIMSIPDPDSPEAFKFISQCFGFSASVRTMIRQNMPSNRDKNLDQNYLALLHDWVEIYSAAADIDNVYNNNVNNDPEYGDETLYEEFRRAMMHLDSELLLEQTNIIEHATGTTGSYFGSDISANNLEMCTERNVFLKHYGF